jgi:hypothetical protein
MAEDHIACLLESDDGAGEDLANLPENIFRRDSELAISGRAFEKRLGRFLVEDAAIDRLVIQLAEREQRCQRHSPVSAAKWTVRQKRKQKRGDFIGKRWVRLAAEGGDLRTLDGVDETELRFDDARMRLVASEFETHGAMKIDEILNREIPNAAVSL